MYHGIAKAIESSRGFCSFPPRALALPVLQSELRSERFWEAAQPRPLGQNKTSSEAALKCFPRSETLIAARRLALQGITWNKPCKHPARWRGVPAGGCAGTAPSFLPRETRPDGSTPSLRCRGEPCTPTLAAALDRAYLQPPLAPPAKRSSLVAQFVSVTRVPRPSAAAPSGWRLALPLSRAPSEPLPRPAGAPGAARGLRDRGCSPCVGPVASQAPVAACEEAGTKWKNGVGNSLSGEGPAARRSPDVPRACLPFAPGPPPRFGLETWPLATALWIRRAQSRGTGAPYRCAQWVKVVPGGLERPGASAFGRWAQSQGMGAQGSQARSLRQGVPAVNAFRGKCMRGGSRGAALALAAFVAPGMGVGSFSGAPPHHFPGELAQR